MKELYVLIEGRIAGRVVNIRDRLSFAYDPDWQRWADAYPLSLSLPLIQGEHGDAAIRAFIWNLLPDNEQTLTRWAAKFQISARNPFALIGAVGEDCAGAAQFVRPDRVDALLAGEADAIEWLDEKMVGDRLRSILIDGDSGRTIGENGQFSLAGAQSKTALLHHEGRWGVPSGRMPTTHILKPPARDLPGHAENEHLCLQLAQALRLGAARSCVERFDGQAAIVVERYDRICTGNSVGDLVRIHQEDMCQATASLPMRKYQNEGGPGAERIIALIREAIQQPATADDEARDIVDADLWTFVRALIFNWLIGGTDAHAKNFSLLLGSQTVRLAPLYDIASAFALPGIQPQKMKLAMKIEYYRLDQVTLRRWVRWAGRVRIDGDRLVDTIRALADELPDALATIVLDMRGQGLDHPVIDRLSDLLPRRARSILAM